MKVRLIREPDLIKTLEKMMYKKTEALPRYELKEITVNGFNRNGTFVTKDKLHTYFGKTEIYQSYYNYSDDIKEHFSKKGGVGGYPGLIDADNLIIDIDFEPDLGIAHQVVKEFILCLESKHMCKSYRVYFSGNKGFHVEIPTFLFSTFARPSTALNLLHEELAKSLIEPIRGYILRIEEEHYTKYKVKKNIFDDSIYDKTRLIRLENTLNIKSGLYKIRLTRDELFNLSIDQIKEEAKSVREPFSENIKTEQNASLANLYYNTATGIVVPNYNHDNNKTRFSFDEDKVKLVHISGFEMIQKNCHKFNELLNQKEFSFQERTKLGLMFLTFGSDGIKSLHLLLSKSKVYSEDVTNDHLDKLKKKEFKPPVCIKICDNYRCPAIHAINRKSPIAFACVSRLTSFNETFIVERFIDAHPNLIYSEPDESFYEYRGGIYNQLTETELKSTINTFMLIHMNESQVKRTQVNDVFERLKMVNSIIYKDRLNQDYGKINLLNGIYDLRSKKLLEHSPSLHHSIQLGFNYDPDAKAPKFDNYLNEVTNGDEEKKHYLLKTLCYCLLPDYSYQKVFVFYGNGRNGKSVLTNLITDLVGEKNTSAISIHRLAKGRFEEINLHNKLVNISSEIAQDDLTLETIKQLSGGDTINAEVKWGGFVQFKNVAKLIINANQLPRFTETNLAMKERFVLINFPRSFTKEEANPNLSNELKEELPGIFNMVISKYDEIAGGGGGIYYPIPQSIIRDQRILQSETSTVIEFIDEECDFREYFSESLQDLYKAYSDFSKRSGYRALGLRNFKKALESDGRLRITRANFGTIVYGLTLRKPGMGEIIAA